MSTKLCDLTVLQKLKLFELWYNNVNPNVKEIYHIFFIVYMMCDNVDITVLELLLDDGLLKREALAIEKLVLEVGE